MYYYASNQIVNDKRNRGAGSIANERAKEEKASEGKVMVHIAIIMVHIRRKVYTSAKEGVDSARPLSCITGARSLQYAC